MDQTNNFQNDRYDTLLKTILDIANNEYKSLSLDWRNRQTSIIRTYLWLCVTILATQTSFIVAIQSETLHIFSYLETDLTFWIFSILGVISAFICFVLAIDTLRGRDGIALPYILTYSDMCQLAYNGCKIEEERYVLSTKLIKEVELAINCQRDQNKNVGNKLRMMSYLILFAISFSLLAITPSFYNIFAFISIGSLVLIIKL